MDKSPSKTLMKTCSSCGLQKPLSAFLELSGSAGSYYGNICSTCRKTNKDASKSITEEGGSKSETGLKIDVKTKIKTDADKKLHFELTKELNQEEREKNDLLKEQQITKTQTIAKKEQQHREEYLKKGSFLDNKRKINSGTSTANKQFFKNEKANNTIDYTKPILNTAIAGKIKDHSPSINILHAWFGKNKATSFLSNIEKMGLDNKNAQAPKVKTGEKIEKLQNTKVDQSNKPTQYNINNNKPAENPNKQWSPNLQQPSLKSPERQEKPRSNPEQIQAKIPEKKQPWRPSLQQPLIKPAEKSLPIKVEKPSNRQSTESARRPSTEKSWNPKKR